MVPDDSSEQSSARRALDAQRGASITVEHAEAQVRFWQEVAALLREAREEFGAEDEVR